MKKRFVAAFPLLLVLPWFALAQEAPCADPQAIIEQFLNANDGARFSASLALLTPDVTLATWATGINGHIMVERHAAGRAKVRPYLELAGFKRISGRSDGMLYKETEMKTSPGAVAFMLRPDKLRPDGRQYNPYQVEMRFSGCRISSITVIERITWL
jgi:hypothetical protein